MKKIIMFALVLAINLATVQMVFAYSHEYYNNHITREQATQADAIARSIANQIMSNKNYKTDL